MQPRNTARELPCECFKTWIQDQFDLKRIERRGVGSTHGVQESVYSIPRWTEYANLGGKNPDWVKKEGDIFDVTVGMRLKHEP